MEYRTLPRGGERVSTIGFGMGSIHQASGDEIEEAINLALSRGVNFFDMAGSNAQPYPHYARALNKKRSKVLYQMHLGAVYDQEGKYGWSRDLNAIKRAFSSVLETMETGYTDFGIIHCADEREDFDEVMRQGIWDYAIQLKEEGVIRHLGFSSHNPTIARQFIETGLIDECMFSINPAYDYSQGDYGLGNATERMDLYRMCEKQGVGIAVMKAFGGGKLLDAKTSPFGQPLSKTQCLAYALDKPGVMTVLPGFRGLQDLTEVLGYSNTSDAERDYAAIGSFTPHEAEGACVYCNHCQPCPTGIDIGMVNKYYDLARAGDEMAANHYEKLALHASDCAICGHCDARCPFKVEQMKRLGEIASYFGK